MGRKRLELKDKKGHISLSLSTWVLDHLRSKQNKSKYVEELIKKDINKKKM